MALRKIQQSGSKWQLLSVGWLLVKRVAWRNSEKFHRKRARFGSGLLAIMETPLHSFKETTMFDLTVPNAMGILPVDVIHGFDTSPAANTSVVELGQNPAGNTPPPPNN